MLSFWGIFGSVFYTTGFLLAKIEKYDEANDVITSLLQNKPNSPHPYELAGDISYMLHENTGTIVQYYIQALVYEKNPRIEEKIRILTWDSKVLGTEKQQEKVPQNNTGTTERLQKIQEIEQTQSGQKNVINPYSALDSDAFDAIIPNANSVWKKDW